MADSGDALFQKAESLAKGGKSSGLWSLFGLGDDEARYEETVEKFSQAAKAYQREKNYKRAGESWRRAAAINRAHTDGGDIDAAAKEYDAFKVLKHVDPEEAIRAMEASIEFYKGGNAQRAAKHSEDLAKFYEQDRQDQKNAMIAYKDAAEQYEIDGLSLLSAGCTKKYGEYLVLLDAGYETAALQFEAVAKIWNNNANMRHGLPDMLLKAGLCRLAHGVKDDMVGVRKKIEKYPKMSTSKPFADSREANFLNELVQAAGDGEPQEFGDACYRWDQKSKLDPIQMALLKAIRTEIENAGEDFS